MSVGNSINLPITGGNVTAGVASVNGLSGPLTIAAGSNVTVTEGGSTITIAAAVTAITGLTGDGTATGPGSAALTLATVNTNIGSFGSSTAIPVFTVNGKGLITAASTSAVVAPAGTLTGTALASNVVTSSLTSLGTQAQALNMGGFAITSIANPTLAQEAATKFYVDNLVSGLSWKPPAQAFSNVNVPLTGGATLTIDSYVVVNGNSVILSNQTTTSQNGVYTVAGIGSAYTLTLRDTAVDGDAYLVLDGTMFGGQAFVVQSITPTIYIQFVSPANYTFNAPLSAAGNIVSLTTGNLTDTGTDGITVTGGTSALVGGNASIAQAAASASQNGYLTSTNWSTFNSKQTALTFADSVVDTTGTVTLVGDSASPGASEYYGTNGSSTKGWYGLPSGGLTALTGDVTATGPGSAAATLATVNTNVGSFGSSSAIPSFTVNAKGLITAAGTHSVLAANIAGGAGGSIPYQTAANTTALLANGTAGYVLQSNGTTLAPTWVAPGGGGGGITSINGDTTAAQVIAAGTGISVSSIGGTTTISATGGGGGVSGPVSSTNTGLATWNGTSGAALFDNDLLYASHVLQTPDVSSGTPQPLTVRAANWTSSSGSTNGAALNIYAGDTVSTGGSTGGNLTVRAGNGTASNGNGGNATFAAGSTTNNTGGNATVSGGAATNGIAGDASVLGGPASAGGNGGNVHISGGTSSATGGNVTLAVTTGGKIVISAAQVPVSQPLSLNTSGTLVAAAIDLGTPYITGTLAAANGGTNASTAAGAWTNISGGSAQTTLTGSAGTAICSQPFPRAFYKKVIIYLNGYTDVGTQVYTFPTAFTFTPYIYGLSAGVSGATVTASTITFTTTTLSGYVFLEGY